MIPTKIQNYLRNDTLQNTPSEDIARNKPGAIKFVILKFSIN